MMPGKMEPAAIGKRKPYSNTTWINGDGPLVSDASPGFPAYQYVVLIRNTKALEPLGE
jgi:hypothetical protein